MAVAAIKFADAPVLTTQRLRLRPWQADDMPAFAAMNADTRVMRFFPAVLDAATSDAFVGVIQDRFRDKGFGLWAVQTDDLPFAGFIGLQQPVYDAPFLPAIEIGWRLDSRIWGRGLAVEGARAALAHGFGAVGLKQIISVAPRTNLPSIQVMERLGMTADPAEDFDHPSLTNHPTLRRCALYRLDRDDFWSSAA